MGGPNMQGTQKVYGGIILATMALGLVLIPQGASSQSTGTSSQEPNTELVPAFHTSVPAGPLPETMSPALFTEPIAHGLAAYQCLGTRFCHMPPVIGATG